MLSYILEMFILEFNEIDEIEIVKKSQVIQLSTIPHLLFVTNFFVECMHAYTHAHT